MDEPTVTPVNADNTTIDPVRMPQGRPKRTAADWVRDMRMSADVNKTTVGVETDRVTPDLLLATSKKLLKVARREQEPDPKDSLEFQRFYGPAEYFAEHVLRDGNKLGRNLLWKATNRGNLDFMQSGALDKHVSDVFYDSKLAQMVDASSPLETVDASYKTTRIGEGGVADVDSAPVEMRTVQPSYFGYIDGIRCYSDDTELMTDTGWKRVTEITADDKLACLVNGVLEYHNPTSLHSYDYNGTMYGYKGTHISYLVTPNHRMLSRCYGLRRDGGKCSYVTKDAEHIHGTNRVVNSALHKPLVTDETQKVFHLPPVDATLKHAQVCGTPPQGASLKNIDAVDIVDFAEYMGWWLAEGCVVYDEDRGYYRVDIAQDPKVSRANYIRIKALIERLPFGAHCPEPEDNKGHNLSIARKQLCCYLKQFGKCVDKFIPNWIFTAPLKAREAFRYAILHGDGRHQRHLCTMSKRLAEDFARLQFELGESVKIVHEPEKRIKNHPGIWIVYWHTRRERLLAGKTHRHKEGQYFTEQYTGKVYCPSVPGELVYCRRGANSVGFWCYNSPERLRVGLDMYLTKHAMKGSDGKLYQRFINARTGKEELVDSVTAAKSVIASPEMMDANTKSVFALGGKTGVRIVPKSAVDYYLPRADELFSISSNMVTMPSGVKEMRLLMGCLHPMTSIIVINKKNEVELMPAKDVNGYQQRIPGTDASCSSLCFDVRNTVAKLPMSKKHFKKVILRSGRVLVTSIDHKWPVVRANEQVLVQAKDLKPGDTVLRSSFADVPNRRTFINSKLVTRDVAFFLGMLCRSVSAPAKDRYKLVYQETQERCIKKAIAKLELQGTSFYTTPGEHGKDRCVGIKDAEFISWIDAHIHINDKLRSVPSVILSAHADIAASFIDGYTSDTTQVGIDSNEDVWLLNLPNSLMRDALAFLFARCGEDTLYRDAVRSDGTSLALKIVPQGDHINGMLVDTVKCVLPVVNAPIMIDIDINDNLYATGNGIITHNSKYPLQAVSIEGREAPLVRGLDEASGKDMAQLAGKYLGARFAPESGVVTAVRKDRIDVLYDNGEKGSVPLYVNFPMNAKGFLNNTPVVKAGQSFKKGDILASSNYTNDKGESALGANLRTGWLSWKGGTYEDAVVLSESAAKKLASTTMYKTTIDLDKTISLGKQNYTTWKPAEYSKEQMEQLDDDGVIKPGSVVHKGDPLILAIQTSEPSPGTLGKRLFTDVSETWDHKHDGIVTDVVRTRKGVRVYATVTAPAEVGDKLSGGYGNKGIISQVLPDDQMPTDEKGRPLELLFSPLGLISRTNASQIYEGLLGKVAEKTGKPEIVPAFSKEDLYDYTAAKLKQNHLNADENLTDPETGRIIPNVLVGRSYIYKLKHLAESKLSARGTDEYDAEGVPAGKGVDKSKRFGGLETTALVGHDAFDVIQDAKLIRGQNNSKFWRDVRTGGIPTIPGEPLVHRKFFAHLIGSGINVRRTPKGISVFTLSNDDINDLAGPRELKTRDTYEAKTFRPIDGGLFGQDIFGIDGDKWAYIQLDEPMPNPVMEEPLARLLRISTKDLEAVAAGRAEISGMKNGEDLRNRLAKIDLETEAARALNEFKEAPLSKRDAAMKRYVAIEKMRRNGIQPAQYMLDKIPVLPPIYRPVTTYNGLTMVADSNYLYAQLLDARNDLRESRDLPAEYQQQARERLYKDWKELTGLMEPEDIKLRSKHVRGLLKWALGDSPKFSAAQRKIIGSTVDTVGRGVIAPDSKLKLNQVGIPKTMAFGIMAPFVERALVQRGYTPVDAMKAVKAQTQQATDILLEVMKTHPVLMNRAPSLHKLNVMGFDPVLVAGDAIRVNPSIVSPFAADFDGDSVCGTPRITVLRKNLTKLDKKFQQFFEICLHSRGRDVYYGCNGQDEPAKDPEKGAAMIAEENKVGLTQCTATFKEIAELCGEPSRQTETVTEWDVPTGFYVDTVDPTSGNIVTAPLTKVSKHTDLTMYDCEMSSRGGFKSVVTVSEDHSLITYNGKTLQLEKTPPQEALGRCVPYIMESSGNDPERCERTVSIDGAIPLSYQVGMFFGLMLGDGWVSNTNACHIACCDASLQKAIQALLKAGTFDIPMKKDACLFTYDTTNNKHRFSHNDAGRFTCYFSEAFKEALGDLIGHGAENKHIPTTCLRGSRAHLIGILMGLLATDGTVACTPGTGKRKATHKTILYHTISPELRDGVIELCKKLGIHATASVYRGPNSKHDCYAITISAVDAATCAKKHPALFRIPHEAKQAALEQMIADLDEQTESRGVTLYDIVPFPRGLLCEFSWAGVSKMYNPSMVSEWLRTGCVARPYAERIVKEMRRCKWEAYKDPVYLKKTDRSGHTPEQAKALFETWAAMVANKSIKWRTVDSVTKATSTVGWDCTVPGPYTFTLFDGTVVQDTVNIHVPVSDNARSNARNRMFPERNLISMRNRKILYKPEKEYQQGLYIATRMKQGENVRPRIFRSLDEARAARRQGLIDVDDPIIIEENQQ